MQATLQLSKVTFKLVILVSVISLTSTATAKIYKWTDANGKINYTATPPPKKANTEEFKIQKIKKSSLTNLSNPKNEGVSFRETDSLVNNYPKVDPTISAQSQCKEAMKNMPAMYSLIKNKIDESKAAEKMSDEQYNTALKQLKISQHKKTNYSDCVRNYHQGKSVETDQIANSSADKAFTYLMLKSKKDQNELKNQLNIK